MRITSRTRTFALLGDPVAHSLSPRMQNAAFKAAGIDAVYLAIACAGENLAALMQTLVRNGGGGNVTLPHKQIAATAGRTDHRVGRIGAANVFGSDGGDVVVGNTDVDGILALLDRLKAPEAAWCVVGTGGSARAVVQAACERGARLAVMSRSAERGAAFSVWAQSLGVEPAEPAECGTLINATPVGLRAEDPVPLSLAALPELSAVADLTYRADGTSALVSTARAVGIRAADGREMLLIQGAAAWAYWLPEFQPPLEVMRAALEGKMG